MHRISQLRSGHNLDGPAILLDEISTVVVEPGCRAHITAAGGSCCTNEHQWSKLTMHQAWGCCLSSPAPGPQCGTAMQPR